MIVLFQRALSEKGTRLTPLLLLWKIKFSLKIEPMREVIIGYRQNHSTASGVLPYVYCMLYRFLRAFQ